MMNRFFQSSCLRLFLSESNSCIIASFNSLEQNRMILGTKD